MKYQFNPKRIGQLFESKQLSAGDLAALLGIGDERIFRWESGEEVPALEHILTMCNRYDLPMDYFFRDDEETSDKTGDDVFGMESLMQLYKIGRGPSSSHTMGPEKACTIFREKYPEADGFRAVLYGSLAKTGTGHGTDVVIRNTFAPLPCEVIFDLEKQDLPHPNTMELFALSEGKVLGQSKVMSVGGGSIRFEQDAEFKPPLVYRHHSFREISEYCKQKRMRLWEYVEEVEGNEIWKYLGEIWKTMKETIHRGLEDEGILPGGLEVQKKAKFLHEMEHIDETAETRENRMVCSFAFAASEQNACYGKVVTAPTCGASGVVPAVLYYQQLKHNFSDQQIMRALATGGLIGNLIKTNASISGAECGCQAEVGTACAMAAAALSELFRLNLDKIEYSAEIAIEHHLGLTCDPICGLVQIPCIERNAVAAMRAINAVNLASFLSSTRKISLDSVIETMRETGRDMARQYKETSEGGLATVARPGEW